MQIKLFIQERIINFDVDKSGLEGSGELTVQAH